MIERAMVAWLAFLAVASAAYCSAPVVEGQSPVASGDALAVARVTVSEAGFRDGDDIDGIFAVIARRARRSGISIDRAARIQSPRPFARRRCDETRPNRRGDSCRTSRFWIAHLRADGRRPRFWPRRLPFPRDRWLELLARAERLVDGRSRHHCTEEPYQWGGPVVDRARIRSGIRRGVWRVTDCGDTRNVFLAPRDRD